MFLFSFLFPRLPLIVSPSVSSFLLCFVVCPFRFLSISLFSASLVHTVAEQVCLLFCSYLCSTPLANRASLQSAKSCASSCVIPFFLEFNFSLFQFGLLIFSVSIFYVELLSPSCVRIFF